MTVTETVPLDELVALYTGVPSEDGRGWSSSPSYDIGLAVAIAERAHPSSEVRLRELIYDCTPVDLIPQVALMRIQLAFARYRTMRALEDGDAA